MRWLIEVDVFPDTAARITAALDRHGVAWQRYADDIRESALPPASDAVIFWGSLGAAYREQVAARWIPGAVGDIARFNCSSYYPHLKTHLANADAVFSSVRLLVSDPSSVLVPLGSDRFFVRPDSPLKPFSGRVLTTSDVSLKALDHGYYYDDEDLAIAISTAKRVSREWRFVVADGKIVAGCEYVASRSGGNEEPPGAAVVLAREVAAAAWQAAPLYVVDVGLVDDAFRVLELNPFSGADFYTCPADAIVEAATTVAERLHREGSRTKFAP